jgi:hypothetical protein
MRATKKPTTPASKTSAAQRARAKAATSASVARRLALAADQLDAALDDLAKLGQRDDLPFLVMLDDVMGAIHRVTAARRALQRRAATGKAS